MFGIGIVKTLGVVGVFVGSRSENVVVVSVFR